jgi:hypothetical protein
MSIGTPQPNKSPITKCDIFFIEPGKNGIIMYTVNPKDKANKPYSLSL